MRSRPVLLVLALAAATAFAGIPATAVARIDFTFSRGILVLHGGPGADELVISCAGDEVVVDGDLTIPAACSKVKRLVLVGTGGDDHLNVYQAAGWPFRADMTADLIGGPGDDDLAAPAGVEANMDGGPGRDRGIKDLAGEGLVTPRTLTDGTTVTDYTGIEWAYLYMATAAPTLDVAAFPGVTTVSGTPGNDTFIGSSRSDQVSLGSGNDLAVTRGGDDSVEGGTGNDTFIGGSGSDVLRAFAITANVVLTDSQMTGVGTDTLSAVERVELHQTGGTGRTISLGAFSGSAVWVGGSGADTVTAPAGGSVLVPSGGADTLVGGVGTDSILLSASTLTLGATTAATPSETITFSSVEEADVYGTSGVDAFDYSNFAGDTRTETGSGADKVVGAMGDDIFEADAGDTLEGNGGNDTLSFFQASGSLELTDTGLAGDQTIDMTEVESAYFEWGGVVTLDASGFTGPLEARSDGGKAITLTSGPGNDELLLSGKNDVVNAGAGDDIVRGEAGSDRINGGPGSDTCFGGPGTDLLKGCEAGKA